MAKSPQDHLAWIRGAQHTVAGLEDGACLSGSCCTSYKKGNSCSYRWEGVTGYRDGKYGARRPNKYVTPDTRRAAVATLRYETRKSQEDTRKNKKKRFNPGKYPGRLHPPQPGDWDVSGPNHDVTVYEERADGKKTKLYTIEKKKNFEKDTWPWWNNAHHLIPKATLRKAIEAVEDPDDWKGAHVRTIIKWFLLATQYNVNHYENMILLPMDTEVAEWLDLPRHLVIDERGSTKTTGDKHPKTDHEKYSRIVNDDLQLVIAEFEETAQKSATSAKCASAEMKDSKKKLEKLSQKCHDALIHLGSTSPGAPISSLENLEVPQSPGRGP